ncbi:MAG: arginine deiminase-related protein [Bacteroidota bacterium]
MTAQTTDTIMMVRPVHFRYNEQTAENNYFQAEEVKFSEDQIQEKARKEFDDFVSTLEAHGINVIVVEDSEQSDTPDSIFPNNWVSFHDDGRVGLYPMYAYNRRVERRRDILDALIQTYGYHISSVIDFSIHEIESKFLEGTGSMILDRQHKIAYAALSMRTHPDVLNEFCDQFRYTPVIFHANQTVEGLRLPIYHTNVMMCVGEHFAIICLDAIDDEQERITVVNSLEKTGKEIIDITEAQENSFAGNMLQVHSSADKSFLVMSGAAHSSLRQDQIERIEKYCPIVSSPLDTIERLGGGSARCMMAEVFLPKIEL